MITFHHFFIAALHDYGRTELQREIDWSCNRRASIAKHKVKGLSAADPHAFFSALSKRERRWVRTYADMFPGEACMLNQNPDARPVRSRRGSFTPC